MMSGFCRDCYTKATHAAHACHACGSPRLVYHQELDTLSIVHIDCDAFYAAVEKRDNPELKDKPLIIGGGHRGVVSTACYLARINGVKSAMPMFKALQLCPQAIVIKPNMARYKAVSVQLRALMDELTPIVEPLSIDEAFLDLSGTEKLHGALPAQTLARFSAKVESVLGITISIGLSYNKYLAKLASDMDKPRGFKIIGRTDAKAHLAALPVTRLWGVGPAMQTKLNRAGFKTIGDIQHGSIDQLTRLCGTEALRLFNLAQGEDLRRVSSQRIRKSLSSETTFPQDISDPEELARQVRRAADQVGQQLRQLNLMATNVTLKLKTADFRSITRTKQLPRPTQTAADLLEIALPMLYGIATGIQFRLIGIGVSFSPQDMLSLTLDPQHDRRHRLESALDTVRTRFGNQALGLKEGHPKSKPSFE